MILRAGLLLSFIAGPVWAEVPRVVTDIAPVQGLAAMILGELGTPKAVMPAGASPHDHALRPSEAGILQDADLVFWIGPMLSPGLERPIATLAAQAKVVVLSEATGTHLLARREEAVFAQTEAATNEDGHGHDEHGHDDEHAHEDGHAHEGDINPHLWLDPENAKLWLDVIAGTLAEADPEHAQVYRDNARAGASEIDAAVAEAQGLLASSGVRTFVAFHDAYPYFEESFGLNALGSIEISDATAPSPARLDALRTALATREVGCIVAEPQYRAGLIAAVSAGTDRPVVIADPMGAEIAPGAGFYPALIRDLAARFAGCGDAS